MFQDNAVSSEIPLYMIGGDELGEKSTRFSAGVPQMIALTQWLHIAGGGRYSDGLSQKLMQTISAADPHFLDDIFVIQHYGVVWFVKTLVVDQEVSTQYSDLNQQPYQNIIRECWIYLLYRHLFERAAHEAALFASFPKLKLGPCCGRSFGQVSFTCDGWESSSAVEVNSDELPDLIDFDM
jgi:hypothetical protein